MTRNRKPPLADVLAAEENAKLLGKLVETLPADVDLAMFLICDDGDKYQSVLVATLSPAAFAPVLRGWLERYDAGETP